MNDATFSYIDPMTNQANYLRRVGTVSKESLRARELRMAETPPPSTPPTIRFAPYAFVTVSPLSCFNLYETLSIQITSVTRCVNQNTAVVREAEKDE